tara:strand:- start:295 stop:993 length:699 start_codon:yes stop_codon:yes gene_type:complete
MKKKLLIIGGDSKISKYLIKILKNKNIDYILTSRRKKKINKNILFFDFLKIDKFVIPQNIFAVIILAGIDGEKKCEKNFFNAKKISKNILPLIIRNFVKKKIFICYLSSMAVYNRNSLYGNLRLLAEKKILDVCKKNKSQKKICIIRPTKNLKRIKNNKTKINKFSLKEYFRPVLYENLAKFVSEVVTNKRSGIFNIIGKKKVFIKKKYYKKRKLFYKCNYLVNEPNFSKLI